jgi:hypothetical protein
VISQYVHRAIDEGMAPAAVADLVADATLRRTGSGHDIRERGQSVVVFAGDDTVTNGLQQPSPSDRYEERGPGMLI